MRHLIRMRQTIGQMHLLHMNQLHPAICLALTRAPRWLKHEVHDTGRVLLRTRVKEYAITMSQVLLHMPDTNSGKSVP